MSGEKLTKAQRRLLEAGARVEPNQRRGAMADGRAWPAISRLRADGLIQVDDVRHGGSGSDHIWFRATEAGRATLKALGGSDEQAE